MTDIETDLLVTALEAIEIRLQRIFECLDERLREIDLTLQAMVNTLE